MFILEAAIEIATNDEERPTAHPCRGVYLRLPGRQM